MTGTGAIRLLDADDWADLRTLVQRAAVADPDGAVRLQVVPPRTVAGAPAAAGTLVVHVGVLQGTGLLGDGTVVGLRTLALAGDFAGGGLGTGGPGERGPGVGDGPGRAPDVVVSGRDLLDRLARANPDHVLALPPVTLSPRWAALSAPRSGWELVGELDAFAVEVAAREGIAAISEAIGPGARAAAVDDERARVWGRRLGPEGVVPAGACFAMHVLGFLGSRGTTSAPAPSIGRAGGPAGSAPRPGPAEPVQVRRSGRWVRLTTSRGHAIAR